jgi:K+/H+ antiporter YhaU regulatory subunit KhtT
LDRKPAQPIYARIAFDIALRIQKGEIKENSKIIGRSILSSEYGVSPETIRKALKLLSDMEIVRVQSNSGAIVISRANADEYIKRFGEFSDLKDMYTRLTKYISEQEKLNQQIKNTAKVLFETSRRMSGASPFQTYEAQVPKGSKVEGQSISDLKFWQQTNATIIAIRREENIILSPGPFMVLEEDDTIIFVGEIETVDAVISFLKAN